MAQMNYTLSVLLKSKLDADLLTTQATYDKAPIIPEKGDILLLSGPNLKEIKSSVEHVSLAYHFDSNQNINILISVFARESSHTVFTRELRL